jgi:hypothetical protein
MLGIVWLEPKSPPKAPPAPRPDLGLVSIPGYSTIVLNIVALPDGTKSIQAVRADGTIVPNSDLSLRLILRPDGTKDVQVVDKDGLVVSANDTMKKLLGSEDYLKHW